MFLKKLLLIASCGFLLGLPSAADGAVILTGDGTTITLTLDSPISIVATSGTTLDTLFVFRDSFAIPPAVTFGVGGSTLAYTITPLAGAPVGPFAVGLWIFGVIGVDVVATDLVLGAGTGPRISAGDTVTLSAGTISFASALMPQSPTSVFLADNADGRRVSGSLAPSAVPEPTNVLFTGLLLGSASLLRFRTRRPLSA